MVSALGFMRLRRRRLVRDAILSIPAIGVPLTVIVLVGMGRYASRNGDLVDRYCTAAEAASESGSFEAAELYYRRLVQLNGRNPSFTYELALLADKTGDDERVLALMNRIAAPPIAYGPANVWLADRLESQLPQASDSERLSHIEKIKLHLALAANRAPDDFEVQVRLGDLYLEDGEFEKGIEHLALAADQRPEFALRVARLEAEHGDNEQARLHAEAAESHYALLATENRATDEQLLHLAEAKILLDDFDEAEKVLLQLTERWEAERPRQALAELYMAKYAIRSTRDWGNRFELLQKTLQYQPDEPKALAALAEVAVQAPEVADATRTVTRELLTRGIAPGMAHFVLGILDAKAGQFDSAAIHLQQAYKADPLSPRVANNLAWVLTQLDPPRLQEALHAADSAVQMDAKEPEFYSTRGQILAKMERWEDCIADLEFALHHYPKRADLHSALAAAYHALGDQDLAEQHERLAEHASESERPEGGMRLVP